MYASAHIANQEVIIYKKLQCFLKIRRDHTGPEDSQRLRLEEQINELFHELDQLHGKQMDRKEWLTSMATLHKDDDLPLAWDAPARSPLPPPEEPLMALDELLPSFTTSPKIYVPEKGILERWRVEAKLAAEVEGEHSDHPRRVVVLVEALQKLQLLLAREDLEDEVTHSKKWGDEPVLAEP